MPTYSVTASELKYASGSSWSSGKARQGVYSSTRYEGAIAFDELAALDLSKVNITQIAMKVTFQKAGRSGDKYLTFYASAKDSISGSIASMRGDYLGKIFVEDAYDRTADLVLDPSTEPELFEALKAYFAAGNHILITYVPTTRDTSSGGFCYDYLGITAMALTLDCQYMQSSGSLSNSSIPAGTGLVMNIEAYNDAYSHKITWAFGNRSLVQNVNAGVKSAIGIIPLTWLDAIPYAASGPATATLETLDENGNSLGKESYGFTVTVPDSVVPTMTQVVASLVDDYETITEWGVYVQNTSRAHMMIVNAAGAYGSYIKSYSITTDPYVGSANTSSFTTGTLNRSGKITVTATITDTRGRTATATTSFTVLPYAEPYIESVKTYRCTSDGTRDDVNGTYAYFKAVFGCSSLNGNNGAAAQVTITQVGGTYSTYAFPESGDAIILGDGNLMPDASYEVFLLVNDELRTYTPYTTHIGSAEYVIHIKKGGKALGIGTAAGDDETVTFGWPLILKEPLPIASGGTGAITAAAARAALGALAAAGGTMTGNLTIRTSIYPSINLTPTYNSTPYRAVLEGSYAGAVSLAAWADSTGNNRRMLEIRNGSYESSIDNAVMLRDVIGGVYSAYRMFHAGMATPIPVNCGGTAAKTAKDALANLGIFFAETLPDDGEDGQICLVPV